MGLYHSLEFPNLVNMRPPLMWIGWPSLLNKAPSYRDGQGVVSGQLSRSSPLTAQLRTCLVAIELLRFSDSDFSFISNLDRGQFSTVSGSHGEGSFLIVIVTP